MVVFGLCLYSPLQLVTVTPGAPLTLCVTNRRVNAVVRTVLEDADATNAVMVTSTIRRAHVRYSISVR